MPLKYVLMQSFSWAKGSIMVLISTLKNIRSRKTVVFFSILGFICLYMMSSYMLPAHRHFHTTTKRVHVTSCLDFHLRTWSDLMAKSDAVFKEIPESRTENKFFPFTGNYLIYLNTQNNLNFMWFVEFIFFSDMCVSNCQYLFKIHCMPVGT